MPEENSSDENANSSKVLRVAAKSLELPQNTISDGKTALNADADNKTTAVLATALVRCQNGTHLTEPIRAVCDTGAQMNLMTYDCAKRLKLHLIKCSKPIYGICGGPGNMNKKAVTHIVPWFTTEIAIAAQIYIIEKLDGTFPSQPLDTAMIPGDLIMADPGFCKPAPIDMLLGVEVWATAVQSPFYKCGTATLMQATRFGHVVMGKCDIKADSILYRSILFTGHANGSDKLKALNEQIERFWHVEEIADSQHAFTREERLVEKCFRRTYYRNQDGRYVVTLPVKESSLPLGDSRSIALRRFFQMERRLMCDSELRIKYIDFMRTYEKLGHMRLVDGGKAHLDTLNYIPHHAVKKEDGEKFRVVFDGSCKTTNGKSLNDILLVGQKLQPDLADQVMRFRRNKIAIVADITKMFRQVCVDPSDWRLQCILWRESPTAPISTYNLTVVTYGLASSGHCAVRAMIQCARDQRKVYPQAAKIIESCMYMDDLLAGSDSIDEGKILSQEISDVLRTGGFELRHWASNSQEIEELMEGHSSKVIELGEADETRVLGLRWLKDSDELTIFVRPTHPSKNPTKREILSEIARLYDPNGLIGPVIVKGKILTQDIWRIMDLGWDMPVPKNIRERWLQFHAQLPGLTKFRVFRWLKTDKHVTMQVHGFCDASIDAYGASIYIRAFNHNNGKIDVTLLVSKSRVAPLKTLSIPRLELQAAELLSRLVKGTLATCEFHAAECFMWTDSTVVLHWLKKTPSDLKTFVGNRVAKIQTASQPRWWSHVVSEDNPADMLSRGSSVEELLVSQKWLKGPKWLSVAQNSWPKPKLQISSESQAEIVNEQKNARRVLYVHARISSGKELLLNRRSNFRTIVRITAYVFRFIRHCRENAKNRRRLIRLPDDWYLIALPSEEEKDKAGIFWFKQVQRKAYRSEIECIKNGETQYPSKSTIVALRPILDKDGMLRASGRIEKANRSINQKHPIIIPGKSRLSFLLLNEAHDKTGHGGTQAMMAYIRNAYWIPNLRRECKVYRSRCIRCVRESKQTVQQIMADLPAARVRPTRPFNATGVDLAGPFHLRFSDKNRHRTRSKANDPDLKGYVVVFVCMVTRAVHLDVVTALTSAKFLEAYQRFTARRGTPTLMYSDNGTNFVGAKNILAKAGASWPDEIIDQVKATWASKEVQEHLNHGNTTWRFIPPGSPNQGGLWESAVKSMKYHLRRIAGPQRYTYEGLVTLLAGIEACLNSRPICAMSDDPEDLTSLTPAHFLIGEPLLLPIQQKMAERPRSALCCFKGLQFLIQSFWQEWSTDYLSSLLQRPKWQAEHKNVRVGQLVLLESENHPPTHWSMGRIVAVRKGNDGCVRSATVKVATGLLDRTVRKLCILPVDTDLEYWTEAS